MQRQPSDVAFRIALKLDLRIDHLVVEVIARARKRGERRLAGEPNHQLAVGEGLDLIRFSGVVS